MLLMFFVVIQGLDSIQVEFLPYLQSAKSRKMFYQKDAKLIFKSYVL